MSRLLVPVAALALAGALVGCSGDDSTTPVRHGLTVSMTGMSPHVGHLLELRVVHAETGIEVGYARIDTVTSTAFDVVVPDVLVAGEQYVIEFYADNNMNGRYDDPPADHAWRRGLGTVAGPTAYSFAHDAIWTDIDFPPHGR